MQYLSDLLNSILKCDGIEQFASKVTDPRKIFEVLTHAIENDFVFKSGNGLSLSDKGMEYVIRYAGTGESKGGERWIDERKEFVLTERPLMGVYIPNKKWRER